MNQNIELFEKAPVPKAVATMAIPTVISMLVVVIYNMADTFFIGQTNDAMQVAAVSLATPVFLIFMALGNLFGIGGSAAISRALGEKNEARAKWISAFCCYAVFGTGIFMCFLFQIGMGNILSLIGASENTIGYARQYLTCIAFGGPFIMFSTAFSSIVRAEGSAKEAMIGNMIGTLINIILDPIMILGFHWGVFGAAIATVIGNIAATGYYILYFKKQKTILSIRPTQFHIKDKVAFSVLSIGLPASLNNILMSLANIILNKVLIQYGDVPVAAMGVAMKANMLVVLLQIGLCMGIQPLIGYNYGARNIVRLKKVFTFTGICAVIMGTFLTLVMVLAKGSIIRAFIDDTEVVTYGMKMLTALMLSGPVIGIMFLCINTLQAMGKALPSLVLTVCRQGLVFVPLLLILNVFFGLDGIIYAQAVADFISIILSVILCVNILKKFEKEIEAH
ncbi:MAG: MATE family efflux transporter [Velocimicrobium sp.]